VHAAVMLDRAGWHVAAALKVAANVSLILLPPKSPQLNPADKKFRKNSAERSDGASG
jgi:hypothetical protein